MKQAARSLVDFLIHFALALIVLGLLAVGIVLMLIFTAADALARLCGPLLKKRR